MNRIIQNKKQDRFFWQHFWEFVWSFSLVGNPFGYSFERTFGNPFVQTAAQTGAPENMDWVHVFYKVWGGVLFCKTLGSFFFEIWLGAFFKAQLIRTFPNGLANNFPRAFPWVHFDQNFSK